MSDFKWSDNQQTAISYVSSNALVSAGAGSGKTAVLTERIYQLVKNGADLSRFLVLTFTNAASAEMKTRIRDKIIKDEETKHLAPKIEASHIETFDAFALFLVKKYAFKLGVSPNIQIIDSTLLSIQRAKIRDKIITHLYSSKDSGWLYLISLYCVKNDSQIRNYIDDICKMAELARDRDEFLDTFIDTYFNEDRIKGFIQGKYLSMVSAIEEAIRQADELEDIDDAAKIIEFLADILSRGKDYDSMVSLFAEKFDFPRKPKSQASDGAFRDAIRDNLKDSLVLKNEYGYEKDIISQFTSTKRHVATLIRIVKLILKELDEFNKEKNSYAFSDIANLALKALDDPIICKEMSDYFDYILVDEYQDTSALQELVINKLAKNNVCMVGDVKQSIYRFRNADCTIFQEKYDKYRQNIDGKLIDLNTSYRSRREIVDLVNEMFEKLMVKPYNPIQYSDGHHFEFGFEEYDSLIDSKEDYKLKIYKYPIIKGKSATDTEIDLMAIDIINKINNKYQVYDKEKKTLRDCSFKDFAIIVDRGKKFNNIKSRFSEYGIPVKVVYDEPVKDTPIAYALKNLLVLFNCAIEEEYENSKFAHAFVSIARSFLCEYKDQKIYDIVHHKDYLNDKIMKSIFEVKNEYKYSPLSEVLKALVNKFDVYRNAIKLSRFASYTNKIELFINLASSMGDLGFGIEDLIQYFEDLNTFSLDIPYVDTDVGEDSVTLITMHRSKGLEYPIVYLPFLTSKFPTGGRTAFLINEKYGAVLPIIGYTNHSSLFNHLIKQEEGRANYEERLRLFYVAITRARERVIMFYGVKENGDGLIINPTTVNNYRSLIHYLNLEYKYGVDFTLSYQALRKEEKPIEKKEIGLSSISVESIELEKKKASKDRDDSVSEDLLEFGNEIHYLLEIANYETKDLSFIPNPRIRKYINNVLCAKMFKNVKNNQVLHEFPFFDEKNGVNGVIDCLIKKDDEIDIVDFKLKNIDGDKYVLQLRTYRDYIMQISKLPIKMYLISAITGEVKEIE